MSIDGSKPWYPQDYPLEEVLDFASDKAKAWMLEDSKCLRDFRNDLKEDHYIRTHGPAGVFFDLRRHLENALHGQQIHQMPQRSHPQKRKRLDEEGRILVDAQRFMGTVDEVITLAICKLEGGSVPDTRFVISDYAVPVLTDDIHNPLLEAMRPCTHILDKYWDMVNSEKSDAPS
jgi:hypothetical protein